MEIQAKSQMRLIVHFLKHCIRPPLHYFTPLLQEVTTLISLDDGVTSLMHHALFGQYLWHIIFCTPISERGSKTMHGRVGPRHPL